MALSSVLVVVVVVAAVEAAAPECSLPQATARSSAAAAHFFSRVRPSGTPDHGNSRRTTKEGEPNEKRAVAGTANERWSAGGVSSGGPVETMRGDPPTPR